MEIMSEPPVSVEEVLIQAETETLPVGLREAGAEGMSPYPMPVKEMALPTLPPVHVPLTIEPFRLLPEESMAVIPVPSLNL
jgi:hypothetical protein